MTTATFDATYTHSDADPDAPAIAPGGSVCWRFARQMIVGMLLGVAFGEIWGLIDGYAAGSVCVAQPEQGVSSSTADFNFSTGQIKS